jgi:hypothetical protein
VTMTCDAWMLGVLTGPMCGKRITIGVRDVDFRMNFMDPLPALLELAREQG